MSESQIEKLGGQNTGQTRSIRQVALASFIGTTIEWYDFFLYGTAAALAFGVLFFPSEDPLVGLLLAFAVFGVGFFARPFGAVFFGHFGDRVGRKAMLVATLLLMGVATVLMGLLPTYETIGIWAPLLLVILRFLQGFAVGGEWGGAVLMAVEHSPSGRRGFYGSWPQMGAPTGLALSLLAFTALAPLSQEQFLAWGWRIPFLASIVLIGVGLFIRLRIMESPAFERLRQTNAVVRVPVVDLIRSYPKNLALGAGAYIGVNAFLYILTVFMIAYATETLGLSRGEALTGVLMGAAAMIFAIPAFASLTDRVGRRPVYMGGIVVMALYAFPFFWLVDTGSAPLVWLAIVLGYVGSAAMYGPAAAFFSELFPARVRYSGTSLGLQLGAVFGGGFAPFVATALLAWSGGQSWAVSAYIVAMYLVSLVCIYLVSETLRSGTFEEDAQEPVAPASGGAETIR